MRQAVAAFALLLAPAIAVAQVPAPVGGDMSNTVVKPVGATVARTLAVHMSELTAQDFSATAGGGSADDTAAVQAAFSSGHPVFLTAGTYSVTCLTVPNGLNLRGAGPAYTIIKQATGQTCPTLYSPTVAGDVSISALTIDANNAGIYAIQSDVSSSRWRVFNNVLKNATQDCLRFGSGSDVVASGNSITGCGIHGITFTTNVFNFAATNNVITSVGGAGIIFSIATDGAISGNSIQNNGPNGDCITGYHVSNLRVTVANNECLGQLNHGIHVGGTMIAITGNNIYTPANYGIFVHASSNGGTTGNLSLSTQVTVSANNVYQPGASSYGVRLDDTTVSTVTGNNVVKGQQIGIGVTLSSGLTITGNNISNTAGTGLLIRGTTNSVVSGNLVSGSTNDGFRCDQDTTNSTGQGTVTSTGNTFSGNSSISNGRDYTEGASGATANYYAFNNSASATSGTSPQLALQAGSTWNGTAPASADLQLATVSGREVLIKDVPSVFNYIQLKAAITAQPPVISVVGDTNRNLNLNAAGTGAVNPGGTLSGLNLTMGGTVAFSGIPTTCTAQPSKSIAAISGVLNLCP